MLGSNQSWALDDMELIASNSMETINPSEFRITSESPFVDYRLDARNHDIQQVTMDVTYAWGHRQAGSDEAQTPATP